MFFYEWDVFHLVKVSRIADSVLEELDNRRELSILKKESSNRPL